MENKKAVIAMSGGVDSSVAAYLMKQAGYETAGVTLKLFDNEDIGLEGKTCCSLKDIEDAKMVACKIGIPHYVFHFGESFREQVIDRFANEYIAGRTPNPCIDCNRHIKFQKLQEKASAMDFSYIATGHYAVREYDAPSGRYLLKKGKDPRKDQSYVLFSLTQEQLARTLFPLGTYTKQEIREIAKENGFINAKKSDSQDICFVRDGDYRSFLETYTGKTFPQGEFIDVHTNQKVGTHAGSVGYTVGQRKGLGVSSEQRYYVVRKDMQKNAVYLGREQDLYSKRLRCENTNFIAIPKLDAPMRVGVKIRYSQQESEAVIFPLDEKTALVEFTKPQRAVTEGQAAVFYSGDAVVGGGTIRYAEE